MTNDKKLEQELLAQMREKSKLGDYKGGFDEEESNDSPIFDKEFDKRVIARATKKENINAFLDAYFQYDLQPTTH